MPTAEPLLTPTHNILYHMIATRNIYSDQCGIFYMFGMFLVSVDYIEARELTTSHFAIPGLLPIKMKFYIKLGFSLRYSGLKLKV